MLILAVVSLGVPLALTLRDRVNAEVHSQAMSQADVVAATSADLLRPLDRNGLKVLTEASAASTRGRVLIVGANGRIVADSAGSSTAGASYASRPEIAAALKGHRVQDQRVSRALGESILATAVPVLRYGRPVGAVRITQSVAAVQRSVRRTVVELALVAGAVLLLGLLAGVLIARQVAQPLGRLERAARRLAGGDLTATAPVEGSAEQRSLSRSFNEMAGRLGRMIGSQREFVADASHQLRTPLTALRLRLEEARAISTNAEARGELDAGVAEVDRLAAIVDELLLLSQAEERELPAEAVDLPEAASRAVARWRVRAQADGVVLSAEPSVPSAVRSASSDLDRVLDVLVENALLYAGAGGAIEIATGAGWVEVRDRGPGLEPGEEEQVFERFHRGGAGRAASAGSGLGLSIARTIARAWGGEVSVRNRPGGGALARLELPVVQR